MLDDEPVEVEIEAEASTADEPAVSADTLVEMPDAPSEWDDGAPADAGPKAAAEERAQEAADSGAAAAAADASGD